MFGHTAHWLFYEISGAATSACSPSSNIQGTAWIVLAATALALRRAGARILTVVLMTLSAAFASHGGPTAVIAMLASSAPPTPVTTGPSPPVSPARPHPREAWLRTAAIEETAVFQANGCILVLRARDKLGARWGGIALAHNVGSRDEVHEIIEQARSSGRKLLASRPRLSTVAALARSLTSTAIPGSWPTIRALDSTITATSSFQPPRQLPAQRTPRLALSPGMRPSERVRGRRPQRTNTRCPPQQPPPRLH
jgi:hypothetical protein